MMLIPTRNLKAIYTHLLNGMQNAQIRFKASDTYRLVSLEGVLVVKKDVRAPKHAEIDVPNLQVMKALLSLKSRGYVAEQFSWQHYYYFLTDEGILFLRSYLHLPDTVVPLTIAKAQAAASRSTRPDRDVRDAREGGRRDGWRNKPSAVASA
jgi:small subunit ribosomal protein S10e